MVYFAVAPSKGVVHLVTETRKWALTELGFTWRAQSWSIGNFLSPELRICNGYTSFLKIGYLDISGSGYEFWLFLLHKMSFLPAGYKIWIYIQFMSADMDMILYPKKVDMTHSCS